MIKFNDYGLLCPSCGGNYLRHDGVFVFNRVEDGKVTTVTTMNGGETTVCQVPSERTSKFAAARHCHPFLVRALRGHGRAGHRAAQRLHAVRMEKSIETCLGLPRGLK
jgi:hypothetical protein